MQFISIEFFVLITISFLIYWKLKRQQQNYYLLAASFFFYGWWDFRMLGLLLVSILIDYYCGLKIYESDRENRRKFILTLSIISNLLILGVFKYYDFFISSLNTVLPHNFMSSDFETLKLTLPLGISFYTFQSMGYTIDIYSKKSKPVTKLNDFALFVSFFPQLVAGPIERINHMIVQFESKRELDLKRFSNSILLISWGVLKKTLLADSLAPYINTVYSGFSTFGLLQIVLATLLFTLQIYLDFSAYTDIARGTAGIFGIKLSQNFKMPYLSTNPLIFWERWHITLSNWFRDYLYYPLSLYFMRKNGTKITRYGAHMITFLLMGLWHGAAINFLVFGAYWGLVIIMYHQQLKFKIHIPNFILVLINIVIVSVGWLLFRVNSIMDIPIFLNNLVNNKDFLVRVSPEIPSTIILLFAIAATVFDHFSSKFDHIRDSSGLGISFLKITAFIFIFIGSLICQKPNSYDFIYYSF